jgi:hypothetical protein
MGRRILRHLRSHVIAYLALFFALTGTAMALPGTNSVDSGDIINGQVKSVDIANEKVNTGDLQDNQVRSSDVRDDTLTNGGLGAADLAPDSVGTSEIAPDSVGTSEIAGSAVRGSELLNYHVHSGTAVSVNDVTGLNGDWTQGTATASCSAGEQLVGAFAQWTSAGDEVATQEIIPDFTANSVTARGIQDDGGSETFQATAVCMFD